MGKKDFDEIELIRKILRSLPNECLAHCVERVFQRAPAVAVRIKAQCQDLPKSKQKLTMISETITTIERLVTEPQEARELALPMKKQDYLNYIDLVAAIAKSRSIKWQVYQLKDYPAERSTESVLDEAAWELRNKIKEVLKGLNLVPRVQMEIALDRVWLRVVVTKKTKDKRKDAEKLKTRKPHYIVYFPGEPYFYSGPRLSEDLGSAVATCLGSSGYSTIELSGQHLDSLRQIRLSRDGRVGPMTQPSTADKFSLLGRTQHQKQDHPELNSITMDCCFPFQGCQALENPDTMEGKPFQFTLEIEGADVIGGLLDLAEEGAVVDSCPVPAWLQNLPTAGRNVFRRRGGDNLAVEWDEGSVVSNNSLISMPTN